MPLTPNSPLKRLQFVAKQYGQRSPGVVLDTFFLLSDLAGVEEPRRMGKGAWIWYRIAFKSPANVAGRAGMEAWIERRRLLWELGPDRPIDDVTLLTRREGDEWGMNSPSPFRSAFSDLGPTLRPGDDLEHWSQRRCMESLIEHLARADQYTRDNHPLLFERLDSDPIWPWVARELNRAKKDALRSGRTNDYTELLEELAGKGPALALWQQQERVDLNSTKVNDALFALESFEVEQGVDQGDVVYEWDDGWTVQKLSTAKQLVEEGEVMQHCVGSYCEEVSSGDTIIYSLRDPAGKPHATMEVARGADRFTQVQGKQNQAPIAAYQERIDEFGEANGIGPVALTDDEVAKANAFGIEMADAEWAGQTDSLTDLESWPGEIGDQEIINAVFGSDSNIDTDTPLFESAEELVERAAEMRWDELYGAAQQQLDDMIDEVAEEAQRHLEDYGSLDDFDWVQVAHSYLWDIPHTSDYEADLVATMAKGRV